MDQEAVTILLQYVSKDKLGEIARNPELPTELRRAAGIRIVKDASRHYPYPNYDLLIKISEDEDLLSEVREFARKRIKPVVMMNIQLHNIQGHGPLSLNPEPLDSIARNKKLSGEVRKIAGEIAVRHYKKQGRFWHLIEMSEDVDLPYDVRAAAGESIKAAALKAVKEYQPFFRDPEIVSKIAMNKRLPEQVRSIVGLKTIQKCVEKKWYGELCELAKAPELPEIVRNTARKRLQETSADEILEMLRTSVHFLDRYGAARDEELPLEFRTAAGLVCVKRMEVNGRYERLFEVEADEAFTEEVRQAARDSVETAALNSVERARNSTETARYGDPPRDLVNIITDERLSMTVKRAAGSALKKVERERSEMMDNYRDIVRDHGIKPAAGGKKSGMQNARKNLH